MALETEYTVDNNPDITEQTELLTRGMSARYQIEQAAADRATAATSEKQESIRNEAVRMAVEEAGRAFVNSLDGLEPHQLGLYYDTIDLSMSKSGSEGLDEIYQNNTAQDVAAVSSAFATLLEGVDKINSNLNNLTTEPPSVSEETISESTPTGSEQTAIEIIENIARERIAAEASSYGLPPEEQAAQRASETFTASLSGLDDNQRQEAIDYVTSLPEKIDNPAEFHHSRLYEDLLDTTGSETSTDQDAVYTALSSVVSEIGSVSGEIEAGTYEIPSTETEIEPEIEQTEPETTQSDITETEQTVAPEPQRVDSIYDPLGVSNEDENLDRTAVYKIQGGDSLSMLVSCFYANDELVDNSQGIRAVSEIVAKANNLENIHSIREGNDLILPSAQQIKDALEDHQVDPSQWYTPETINTESADCTICAPGAVSYTDAMKI